ncbi:MAG TPA: S41 family peptidase [Candidatus Obscuribacterales bacterium]
MAKLDIAKVARQTVSEKIDMYHRHANKYVPILLMLVIAASAHPALAAERSLLAAERSVLPSGRSVRMERSVLAAERRVLLARAQEKAEKKGHSASAGREKPPAPPLAVYDIETDRKFNEKTIDKIDKIVSKELYSAELASKVWPDALRQAKGEILASKNLHELYQSINKPIRALKSSHCQFVTTNDETYHFLHSLFSSFSKKLSIAKMDYTGMVTGGLTFQDNEVRYVLDGSPADKAGVKVGDKILSVDDKPYIGQSNFFNTANKLVRLTVLRGNDRKSLSLRPVKKDNAAGYVEAIEKSARVIFSGRYKLGYVHFWCGGRDAHEAFLSAVTGKKLSETDGLILDLRDGYGGNSLEDIDVLYRNPEAFPIFVTKMRSGKSETYKAYYDKPVVALINGGSRSGKELLAYSLKKAGRARLVGTTTAGAVLAGRLFPLNERSSLYLAIADGTVDGVRLEGRGVAPDIEVQNNPHDPANDVQLAAAKNELLKEIERKQ